MGLCRLTGPSRGEACDWRCTEKGALQGHGDRQPSARPGEAETLRLQPGRGQPCLHVRLRLPPPELWEHKGLLYEPPGCGAPPRPPPETHWSAPAHRSPPSRLVTELDQERENWPTGPHAGSDTRLGQELATLPRGAQGAGPSCHSWWFAGGDSTHTHEGTPGDARQYLKHRRPQLGSYACQHRFQLFPWTVQSARPPSRGGCDGFHVTEEVSNTGSLSNCPRPHSCPAAALGLEPRQSGA